MESMLAARLHAFGRLLVRMRNPRQLSMDRLPPAAAYLEGIDELIVAAIVLALIPFPRAERLELGVFEPANPDDPGRDNALHEVHGLWAQWLALRGATAVLVRPEHLVYGSAIGTDSGLVLAQALERDLKAEHRDGAARAGATQVASSSG
jgi:hypothetical protein